MRQIKWLLTLALASCAPLVYADSDNGSDCGACCSGSSFDFYADVLYWEICRGDVDFDQNGTRYVQPDHDVGYRVGGRVICNCWDLNVRYTSFETSENYGAGASLTRRYEIDLDSVDVETGYSFCFDCLDGTVRPFVGVKSMWLEEIFINQSSSGDRFETETDGYGLYIGTEVTWPFYDACVCDTQIPIALVVRGAWGIMNASVSINSNSDDYEKVCIYLPHFELFVGINFDICICDCLVIDIHMGYEAQVITGLRRFNDGDDNADLGMGGLTTRFGLQF